MMFYSYDEKLTQREWYLHIGAIVSMVVGCVCLMYHGKYIWDSDKKKRKGVKGEKDAARQLVEQRWKQPELEEDLDEPSATKLDTSLGYSQRYSGAMAGSRGGDGGTVLGFDSPTNSSRRPSQDSASRGRIGDAGELPGALDLDLEEGGAAAAGRRRGHDGRNRPGRRLFAD